MEKCPFCGLHPFEYVNIGIGQQAVAVNCCEYGYLLYDRRWSYRKVKAYQVYSDVMSWFWSIVHRLTRRAADASPAGFEDEEFDALLDSDIDGK